MKIKTQEIPEQGKNYNLNRQTAELNEVLADLVHDEPYKVELFIKPVSSKDYQISGKIETATSEQCSLCADDFKFQVHKKVTEFLIPYQEEGRKGHYSRTAVDVSNEGQDLNVSVYRNGLFDLGEFVHEAIALEVPFNPKCSKCLNKTSSNPILYDEKMGEEEKKNPFHSLKGLKLN